MASKYSFELSLDTKGYTDGTKQAEDANADFVSSLGNVRKNLPSLTKDLAAAKREAKDLAYQYYKLSAEQKKSGFGKEIARQLEEAKKRTAELIDLNIDLGNELKNRASDTSTLDALAEGFGAIGNAATATLSGIALVTGEQEDLNRAIAAYAAVESTVNTIIKIANALQKESALMTKINTLQSAAAAKAKLMEASATGKATVAQKLFNAVAKANPYVLLASAVLTVVSALTAFAVFSRKSAEEQERQQRITERQKEVTDSYYNALNSSLEDTIPKYINLKTEWENLRTEAEKIQWIKDNKDEFNSLGIEVNNVNDAENVLETNTQTVMESFMQRARSIAIAAQAAEIYKQALKDIQWLEEHKDDKNLKSSELAEHGFGTGNATKTGNGGLLGLGHARYQVTDIEAEKKAREKAATEAMENLYKEMGRLQKDSETNLTNAGIKVINDGAKKKNAARSKANKKEIHKNSLEEAEELVKVWETALKKADINDTELINRINKEIDKAKKEVERRKIVLGIDVKIKNSSDLLKDYENALQDAASNAEAALVLASVNGEIDKVDELTEQWELASQALKNYQATKEFITKGITKTGDGSIFNTGALTGNFPATIKGYSDAISAIQQKLQSSDWGSMTKYTDEAGRVSTTFQEYIDLIQQYKAELQNLNEIYEDAMLTPQEKAQRKLEKTYEMYGYLESAAGSLGSAFSSLSQISEDEGINVAGVIAQTIAEMSLSFAKMLKTTHHWTEWVAFGSAGLAQLLSMIATIKSTNGFAGGGVVGGSSYYGDRMVANVNSGEMILNRRQQKNLFDAIDNDKLGNAGTQQVFVTGKIRGNDIVLVQKNTIKELNKTGKNITF